MNVYLFLRSFTDINAVPDRTFLKLCSHVQSCWKICSIPKSEYFWLSMTCIWLSLLVIRETERDWDKDLAEDVKGECESKYGPVTAIKVEKETQVSPDVRFFYLSLTVHRARSMSNSMLSKMPKRLFKDSMVVGLVDAKYLQPLSLTLSCKLINRMLKNKISENIPLNHFFDRDPPNWLPFFLRYSISYHRNMQIFRLLFRAVVLVIARWQAGSTLITFDGCHAFTSNIFFFCVR